MQVHELMTQNPIEIPSSASLHDAVALMEEHAVRHLAVVDDGAFRGVVSERDLLRANGWLEPDAGRETLRDVLTTDAATAEPDDDVGAIARKLFEQGVGCLPIVRGETALGIVSEIDVLRTFLDKGRYGRASEHEDPPVQKVMSVDVATAAWNTTADEAWQTLREGGFRHLPVVEDERLVGILSDRDLLLSAGRAQAGTTPIGELMTSVVVTARPEDRVSYVARQIVDSRIGATPIVDRSCLVGMVSSADLLQHCADVLAT